MAATCSCTRSQAARSTKVWPHCWLRAGAGGSATPSALQPTITGFVLSPAQDVPVDAALLQELLSPARLFEDLRDSLNLGELARRQFREIARVAGLLSPSLPGRAPRSLRQLQASSGLLYDVLQRFDPEHLLLAQAEREVFEGQLEFARLASALEDCAARVLRLCTPRSLTPLSFPLWAERVRGQLSTEDWKARVLRAAAQLERKHGR